MKKVVMNITMTALMLMLMAYSLIGERFHEVIGVVAFFLFLLHHILNRGWYRGLLRGAYPPRRLFRTLLNLLLLFFVVFQPLSGVLMSKHLCPPLIPGISALVREVHLLLAYWGFLLVSLHVGTHLTPWVRRVRNRGQGIAAVAGICWGAISLYGGYALVKRDLPDYLFHRSGFVFFDYDEPRVFFFLDYFAVMLLFFAAGYLATAAFGANQRKKGRENETPAR
ncbi:MAG: cytochrome b/b6 domain-containing protein [Thermoguttaceae bacterium]|jgi:hypothetical protein